MKPAIPSRTRNFISHRLASRKPAATAAAVAVPTPLQSTSPSRRPSSAPHAAHCEVTRAEGLTPTPLQSCRHRCSAAVEMPGSTAGCQRLGRRRVRSTPPTSITASLRATPARPAVLRSSSQPCALFLSLHHR